MEKQYKQYDIEKILKVCEKFFLKKLDMNGVFIYFETNEIVPKSYSVGYWKNERNKRIINHMIDFTETDTSEKYNFVE